MLDHILSENHLKVASASTVFYRFNKEQVNSPTKKTSQDCREINKFLREAINRKCEIAILEVSSVALDQGRFNGIDFQAVGITNITPEELKYHGSMKKYRAAKKLLFQKCHGAHVLPARKDFEDFAHLSCQKRIIWGIGKTQNFPNSRVLIAENIKLHKNYSEFKAQNVLFKIPIFGDFNIENALCAASLALTLQVSLESSSLALKTFKGVSGRLEEVDNNLGMHVFVDYALTPNAFERLLQNMRLNYGKTKIIIVFGCAGGGRDRSKRPIMGKLAGQLADYTIITDDESYDEKTANIMKEIVSGIDKRAKYEKIPDRRAAIAKALKIADSGDVVLVTGIGAETSRNISGKEIAWSDVEVIKEELRKLQP